MKRIIDAKDARMGRIASVAAKSALLGQEVVIVNCESAIVSGSKKSIESKWKGRMELGQPYHGPFFQNMPDRFMRRVVRGMLPHKQPKGKEAYARVQCYIGVPDEYQKCALERISNADMSHFAGTKYLLVKDVCKILGGKTL